MATSTDTDSDKQVVNLSSRALDNKERQVLSKGLNFGIAPSRTSNVNMVMSLEPAVSYLPKENKESYRCNIIDLLKRPSNVKSNLTRSEQDALKQLRNDDTIVILPSDKGGAVVLMNQLDYKHKISDLINGGQYKKIDRDPTNTVQNVIKKELVKIKSYVSDRTFFQLSPQFSKAPHLYGLPKIHKPDIPLRPIVSAIGSPYYQLSKYILPFLSPLFGHSDSYLKNSSDFVEKIKLFPPTENTILVSFDVTNLFPNVPIEPCLSIVREMLDNDNTLIERTKIPVSTIMELLSVCIQSNYFQVENDFYEQTSGMAMGGVLSPILCNLFMDRFEKDAINSSEYKPRLWLRYVDDIFCMWEGPLTDLMTFKDHLNSQCDTIKFTIELEDDNKLPFLDVLVEKQLHGWHTSIYRKPTATGHYLNFNSNHPTHVKTGIVIGLIMRAKSVCSSEEIFNSELEQIKLHLANSGYPTSIFNKALKAVNNKNNLENTTKEKPITTVCIPYIKNVSEKIRRINSKHNIRTVFKCKDTIRSRLTKVKPVNKSQNLKNVVYQIPCSCGRNYIGQTSRPVTVRINEHIKKVKNKETYGSRICEHVMESDHVMRWDESMILFKEPDWRRRNIAESMFMAAENEPLSQPSVDIHPSYQKIINNELKHIRDKARKVDGLSKVNRTPSPAPSIAGQANSSSSVVVRRSTRVRAKIKSR